MTDNWRNATCGECGYWHAKGIVLFLPPFNLKSGFPGVSGTYGGKPVFLPGCKNGHRDENDSACPDFVRKHE